MHTIGYPKRSLSYRKTNMYLESYKFEIYFTNTISMYSRTSIIRVHH